MDTLPSTAAPASGPLDVLFENATIGLGLFDGQLRAVRLNPRYRALAAGRLAGARKHMARALGEGVAITGVHLRVDGRTLACDFHPMPPGPDGRATGLAVVVTDLTEEVAGAERMAASEARLRQVLDAVAAFAVVVDGEGVVVEANAQALGAAGLTPSDVRARALWDTYWFEGAEAKAQVRDALARARAGETVRYRAHLRVGPDKTLTMDIQADPIRDSAGRVLQIVVSATDVTTLVEAQESQALLTAELNHRVKNILAVVRALVAQSARRAPTKEALAEALEGRIAAMARAAALVSRSQWSGFGLADVLREQIEAYGADRFKISGPNITVTAKAALGFALITYELATNALKYGALSREGGRVDLSWSTTNGALEWAWVERGGPPAAVPSETGFGTLLVRAVAEGDLGGALELAYEPAGLRAKLTTTLKALQGAKGQDRAAARERSAPLAGKSILVVEDCAIIALEVCATLEGAGAGVVGPASSVDEALALVAKARIDAALLDIDLDGASSAPVRAALARAGIPVLTVAAPSAGAAAPGMAVLSKPFTDQELLGALTALLAPARSAVGS